MAGRFIDLQRVKEAKELIDNLFGVMFCDRCGDTQPKHGFFPLFHSPSVSGVTCNRCWHSDRDYKRIFGEQKERMEEDLK